MNDINNLLIKLKIGELISEPLPISGGLLHKMYRVATEKGLFAVKVLNPEIMKRPEALRNTIRSEKIAGALAEEISLVAALEFVGKQIHEWQGNYYMFFHGSRARQYFRRILLQTTVKQWERYWGKCTQKICR